MLVALVYWVFYQVAVGRVATMVDASTSGHGVQLAAYRQPSTFFIRSINQWKRWRDAHMAAALKASSGLVVTTDLSSYFEPFPVHVDLGALC